MRDDTEDDIVNLGIQAESLMMDPGFNTLFNRVTEDLALAILATPFDDRDYRDQLYLTYNGMRAFADRLTAFVVAKEEVKRARDEQNEFSFEDDN